jgi:hypothetical protein
LFAVRYIEDGIMGYYCHQGGKDWALTAPKGVTREHAAKTIDIKPLYREEFFKNLPRICFKENSLSIIRVTTIERFLLSDNHITLECAQEPDIEGHRRFLVSGIVRGPPRSGGGRTYLSFNLDDAFGNARSGRVYHDGNREAWLGICYGSHFAKATMIKFDGARLMFTYNLSRTNRNTILHYLHEPSMFYAISNFQNEEKAIDGFGALQTAEVIPLREREKSMLESRSMYIHGILGAEIAYSICKTKLRLRDLVLQEPSLPGPDLYTKDDENLIQARFLTHTFLLSPSTRREIVERHLRNLRATIRTYLRLRRAARSGYCILSYVDGGKKIQTLILRVDMTA